MKIKQTFAFYAWLILILHFNTNFALSGGNFSSLANKNKPSELSHLPKSNPKIDPKVNNTGKVACAAWDGPELSTFIKKITKVSHRLECLPELPEVRGVVLVSDIVKDAEYASCNDDDILQVHHQILNNLPKKSKAIVITENEEHYKKNFPELIQNKQLHLYNFKTDSVWVRDYFPETIIDKNGNLQWIQFEYYAHRPKDNKMGEALAQKLNIPIIKVPLELEGGNILVDSKGRLFISEKTKNLNMKRKNLSSFEIEKILKNSLNVKFVNWIKTFPNDNLAHIDMYAKLIGKNKILVADSNMPDRKLVLDDLAKQFSSKGLKVIRIKNGDGPNDDPNIIRTFTNSLVLGDNVFLPTYHTSAKTPLDTERENAFNEAKKKYTQLGFNVYDIPCSNWIGRYGAIHCLTKHIP